MRNLQCYWCFELCLIFIKSTKIASTRIVLIDAFPNPNQREYLALVHSVTRITPSNASQNFHHLTCHALIRANQWQFGKLWYTVHQFFSLYFCVKVVSNMWQTGKEQMYTRQHRTNTLCVLEVNLPLGYEGLWLRWKSIFSIHFQRCWFLKGPAALSW